MKTKAPQMSGAFRSRLCDTATECKNSTVGETTTDDHVNWESLLEIVQGSLSPFLSTRDLVAMSSCSKLMRSYLRFIVHLELKSYCPTPPASFLAGVSKNLKVLNIHLGYWHDDDVVLLESLWCNNFPSLEQLYISNMEEACQIPCDWCFPLLHTLTLCGSSIKGIISPQRFPKLKELDVQGCYDYTDVVMPQLEVLKLTNTPLLHLSVAKVYPRLVELCVWQCTLDSVEALLRDTNLQSLILRDLGDVGAWSAVVDALKPDVLTTFDFQDTWGAGIGALVDGLLRCTKLQSLTFNGGFVGNDQAFYNLRDCVYDGTWPELDVTPHLVNSLEAEEWWINNQEAFLEYYE